MTQNIQMVRKMKIDVKNLQFRPGMGFGISMAICVGIGIALSEIWGFHDVYFWSIILGSSTGVSLEGALERRYQKSNS